MNYGYGRAQLRFTRRWLRSRHGWAVSMAMVMAVLLASPSSAGRELKRFDRCGIAFEYPSQWFTTTRPLSNAVNPAYRFVVSNVPVRRTRADVGPCLPGIAKQLPTNAVLAYLREALGRDRVRSLPRMSKRPRSFRLATRAGRSLCGFGPGARWVPFTDAGRAFYLGVFVGVRASAQERHALKRLLEGMQIDPR